MQLIVKRWQMSKQVFFFWWCRFRLMLKNLTVPCDGIIRCVALAIIFAGFESAVTFRVMVIFTSHSTSLSLGVYRPSRSLLLLLDIALDVAFAECEPTLTFSVVLLLASHSTSLSLGVNRPSRSLLLLLDVALDVAVKEADYRRFLSEEDYAAAVLTPTPPLQSCVLSIVFLCAVSYSNVCLSSFMYVLLKSFFNVFLVFFYYRLCIIFLCAVPYFWTFPSLSYFVHS